MWRRRLSVSVGLFCLSMFGVATPNTGRAIAPAPPLPPPSLLTNSQIVFDLNRWHRQEVAAGGLADCEFAEPIWLGPHTLLAQDRYADGAFLSVFRVDMKTGFAQHLKGLTSQIKANGGYLKPADWSLSPDGQWLLWKDGELQRGYTIVATRLDGSCPSRRWPVPTNVNMREVTLFWLPGGHRFVDLWTPENTVPTEAHLYDLDVPNHAVQKVSLAGVGAGREVIGVGPDRIVLARDVSEDATKSSAIRLTSFQLEAPVSTQRHWTIPLSVSGKLQSVSLSPDRQRLAILVATGSDKSVYTLMCSQLDGSGMLTIGTFAPDADFREMFVDGWTQDGKKIVFDFVYGNKGKWQRELREVSAR